MMIHVFFVFFFWQKRAAVAHVFAVEEPSLLLVVGCANKPYQVETFGDELERLRRSRCIRRCHRTRMLLLLLLRRYVTPGQIGSAAFDVNVGDVEIVGRRLNEDEALQ